MSGIAIIMMALFIVIIWGGFVAALVNLSNNPDDSSGALGSDDHMTNEELAALEQQ
ncbi:methionine/alanine import NSS transporter subunit MetS [Corynebacterium sp. NPDC060344]|uniref:methionine/alanine import NSS transporter subunit MetS n=1 Tax=Corynebacterium sp. NPDC060344 TaxID=3347101 RepID=UPI00365051F7